MFNINQRYNFTTLAPAILGATYTNLRVTGIITFQEAVKRSDVVTKHASIRPVIQGLPVTPHDLIFIVFEDANNNEIVMAQDYIDPNTIVVVTTISLDIQVYDVASNMEPVVRQYLKELGITNFKLTAY